MGRHKSEPSTHYAEARTRSNKSSVETSPTFSRGDRSCATAQYRLFAKGRESRPPTYGESRSRAGDGYIRVLETIKHDGSDRYNSVFTRCPHESPSSFRSNDRTLDVKREALFRAGSLSARTARRSTVRSSRVRGSNLPDSMVMSVPTCRGAYRERSTSKRIRCVPLSLEEAVSTLVLISPNPLEGGK